MKTPTIKEGCFTLGWDLVVNICPLWQHGWNYIAVCLGRNAKYWKSNTLYFQLHMGYRLCISKRGRIKNPFPIHRNGYGHGQMGKDFWRYEIQLHWKNNWVICWREIYLQLATVNWIIQYRSRKHFKCSQQKNWHVSEVTYFPTILMWLFHIVFIYQNVMIHMYKCYVNKNKNHHLISALLI